MKSNFLCAWMFFVLLTVSSTFALAQQADEEAYFRLFVAQDKNQPGLVVDVFVDGKLVQSQLAAGVVPPFVKVMAGRHDLAVYPTGKTVPMRTLALEAIPGNGLTIAFDNLSPRGTAHTFIDPLPSGRRQTRLNFYHVDTSGYPVDAISNKGGRIFSALAPGNRASLGVNPIKVELAVVRVGYSILMSLADLEIKLMPGRSHSVFFMPESGRNNRMVVGEDIFPARP